MEVVEQVVGAYRAFDPAAWVGVYRLLPMWVGLVAVAAGVLLLLFGGGRAFRFVAVPMGAIVGALWASVVADKLGFSGNERAVALISAGALAIVGFAFPPAAVFFAFGLPLGLLGGELAGPNDWLVGFLPGFLLGGVGAAIFHRHIGAVAASVAGAWLLCIGSLAALHQVGSIVAAVASQPFGVLIAAALFAVAGSVYQLAVRPSPEEADRIQLEKLRARKKLEERRALEARWGRFDGDPE